MDKSPPPGKSISFIDRCGPQQTDENSLHLTKSTSFNVNGGDNQPRALSSINDIWNLRASKGKGGYIKNMNADSDLSTLNKMCEEMDILIQGNTSNRVPVETFTNMVQSLLDKYDSPQSPAKFEQDVEQDNVLLDSIARLSKLNKNQITPSFNTLTSNVLHRAMTLLEDEFRSILEYSLPPTLPPSKQNQKDNENPSSSSKLKESQDTDTNKKYPGRINEDNLKSMRKIASTMILGGYETECCQVYSILRSNGFKQEMQQLGLEKVSIDEVQKMSWETLETHVTCWNHVVKQVSRFLLPAEKNLCHAIFSPQHSSIAESLLSNLARSVVILFLHLPEAVAMTKRTSERLFKVLDIYETMNELMVALEASLCMPECVNELLSEISCVRRRVGEAAVCIFCDVENSIKNDTTKNPVPGGAVHPLTRYTMNYIRYACDFKETLEQVFSLNHNIQPQCLEPLPSPRKDDEDRSIHGDKSITGAPKATPVANEIINIMGLLDANLNAKSRLYKDPSLRYIFLMNNGRYILQKIKESPELHELVGNNFKRKRSTELRGFHKSYQRETWSRVLQCLNQEGLQVNGKVQKSVLKERFKSFNQAMDEIYKTQSTWVVSDEQLQSELRVSISAVMIPAYRSFLARFGQYFNPGRQSEKYIKYQPDDIESTIESLFDGTQNSSIFRKKN